MPKYCVPIVYTGLENYIVEAETPEKAKALAKAAFKNGEKGTSLGNEWEEIDRFGDVEEIS